MSRQSQRLRRVLRKYALDARLALLETAKAECDRNVLTATVRRLDAARNEMAHSEEAMTGSQFAARGEWSERLTDAGFALQPSIQRAEMDCSATLQCMRQAKRRVEQVEERILQTARFEERLKEGKSGVGQHRRKARREPRP